MTRQKARGPEEVSTLTLLLKPVHTVKTVSADLRCTFLFYVLVETGIRQSSHHDQLMRNCLPLWFQSESEATGTYFLLVGNIFKWQKLWWARSKVHKVHQVKFSWFVLHRLKLLMWCFHVRTTVRCCREDFVDGFEKTDDFLTFNDLE